MLVLRNKIKAIILDLTGNQPTENYLNYENYILRLTDKYPTIYFGEYYFERESSSFVYLAELNNSYEENISKLRKTIWKFNEYETLVLTNNVENIALWNSLNYTVIFIKFNNDFIKFDHKFMPDEIWDIKDIEYFISNKQFSKPFHMNQLGTKDVEIHFGSVIGMECENKFNQVKYDVLFSGHYYIENDPRHYVHPLSRAIKSFKEPVKRNLNASRLSIFKLYALLLKNVLTVLPEVQLITAVPPRPNEQHRFYKFEEYFSDENVKLDFDLLESKSHFKSPKHESGFLNKYNCVRDVFRSKRKVNGHIILIDDIFTSGVTTSECVKVLLDAGATKVTVVPLAHTQNYNAKKYTLNGIFDENGNEYIIRFNRTHGNAFWIRENLEGYLSHTNALERYLVQNKAPYSYNHKMFNPDNIQAIIFDLDNTLVMSDALERYRFSQNLLDKDYVLMHSTEVIPAKGVNALRKKGFKIGIVTRTKYSYAKVILDAYGYEYDALVTRYDCLRTKPYGDPFIVCLGKLQSSISNSISIGNEDTDTIASSSIGLKSIQINKTHTLNDTLEILNSLYKKQYH